MQLATTSHPTDKSSWARVTALPNNLPAPAVATTPAHPVTPWDTPAKLATSSTGVSNGLTTEVEAAKLLGRDPRAALAAAAAMAGQELLVPIGGLQKVHARTAIGLFETRPGGELYAAPLWKATYVWYDKTGPMPLERAADPDARVKFTDQRLLAVVGADGYVANPAAAGRFDA
jgi:hypothetical protein